MLAGGVPTDGKTQRVRRMGVRPQPYDAQRDRPHTEQRRGGAGADPPPADDVSVAEMPANSYKVAGVTDVRELAGVIVAAVGEQGGELPALLTIGHASINQAVKGIAVASGDLRGQLMFQPAFRHTNRTKPLIAFYLSQQPRPAAADRAAEDGEVAELTATANQKVVALAGAIAGKVREARRTHVIAIGAEAVTNAVLAIGNARLFLEENKLDIKILPEFVRVQKNEHPMHAIKLNVIPEKIDP